MNSAKQVEKIVSALKEQGKTRRQIIVSAAESCLGWPYVWGAVGADCTPDKRRYYMGRGSIGEKDRDNIKKNCPVLSGKQSVCRGCDYYPNNQLTLINDCQGFVKNIFGRVGITFSGGGCTSMWNSAGNWVKKGKLASMPNEVCLVFIAEGDKMSHVGIHVGGGRVIHCSKYVREGKVPDKNWGWSHWAIPKGLDGNTPSDLPTLRRGSSGEYVTLLQTKLIQRGYNLGASGADGKFGAKTELAVKDFQKNNGLTADGICGPKTWEALQSGSTTLYTVTVQHVSKSVAESIVNTYGGSMKAEEG